MRFKVVLEPSEVSPVLSQILVPDELLGRSELDFIQRVDKKRKAE